VFGDLSNRGQLGVVMRLAMLWLLSWMVASAVGAQVTAYAPKIIDFAVFRAESVDPLWAQGMEARILDEIAQIAGLELFALQVECRTSLCRVQLTTRARKQTDGSPALSILKEPVAKLGLVWQQMTTSPPQGATETSVAYLRRPGTGWAQTSDR